MTAGKTEKISFAGAQGDTLAAALELPAGRPRAYALFAHCFSCSKDIHAARNVTRALRGAGFAILRFDFTGLGLSDGDFSNTNFSSNVADLVKAADYLRDAYEAPALLIGHSLGGAAVLAAASEIAEAKAVATIAAPADAEHVTHNFAAHIDEIKDKGEAEVSLAGRPFTIKKQFLDDVAGTRLEDAVASLKKALLVMHAPLDDLVGVDNATRIFVAAKHPKSFVSLDGADHLLSRESDARYAGEIVAAWAARYVEEPKTKLKPIDAPADGVVAYTDGTGRYSTKARGRGHLWTLDADLEDGGDGYGPNPTISALGAMAACGVITVHMYAERKGWNLSRAAISVRPGEGDADPHAPKEVIKALTVEGDLDETQRARLLEIADKCPVARMMTRGLSVRSSVS